MNQEIKSLLEAKHQWENDIKMYNDFLKSKSETIEGEYGAKQYISMAENRISDINNKLKELKKNNKKYL